MKKKFKNFLDIIVLFRLFIVLIVFYLLIDVELKYFLTHFATVTLDYRLMRIFYDYQLNHYLIPQNLAVYSGTFFFIMIFSFYLREKIIKFKKFLYFIVIFIPPFFIERIGIDLVQLSKETVAAFILFLFCYQSFKERSLTKNEKKYFVFYVDIFRSHYFLKRFTTVPSILLKFYRFFLLMIPYTIFFYSFNIIIQIEKMTLLRVNEENKYLKDTYYSKKIGDNLYFTYTDFSNREEGLYVYSFKKKNVKLVHDYFDPHRFELDYPFLYFYDRNRAQVVKRNLELSKNIWTNTVLENGSYLLFGKENKILAASEFGYFFIIDKDSGKTLRKKIIDERTDYVQFVNDEIYFINDSIGMNKVDKKMNFVGLSWIPAFRYSSFLDYLPSGGSGRFINWTYYLASEHKIFASTLWGEIWVYDIDKDKWDDHYKTQFGVRSFTIDTKNNLLITTGFINGIVEIIDLKTKEVLKRYRGGSLARYITLDTESRFGLIHTNGRGVWRFNY